MTNPLTRIARAALQALCALNAIQFDAPWQVRRPTCTDGGR
jgi:hypothetical protein